MSGRIQQVSGIRSRKPRRERSAGRPTETSHSPVKTKNDLDISRDVSKDRDSDDLDRRKPKTTRRKHHPSSEKSQDRDDSSRSSRLYQQRVEPTRNSKRSDTNTRNEKSKEKLPSKQNNLHPLFQDSSKLAQLVGQITNINYDGSKRIAAVDDLQDYLYDPANAELIKRVSGNLFNAMEDVLVDRGNNKLKDKVYHSLGFVGHLLGIDCKRFFSWAFSKLPSAESDQRRAAYLRCVLHAMELDTGKRVFYDAIPTVMRKLQDVLENVDSSELLLVVMDLIVILAREYPHIFADYFRDTVDILVGWHIDTTQNSKLIEKLSACLVDFHPFWLTDINFSKILLGQFLEDMEGYAEELKCASTGDTNVDEPSQPSVPLAKLAALVRVYSTVVSGIGEYFTPARGSHFPGKMVNETIVRIVACVNISRYNYQHERLTIAANNCLSIMVSLLGTHIAGSCHHIVALVIGQLKHALTVGYDCLHSGLALLRQVIDHVGVSIPVSVVQLLFASDSSILDLRQFQSTEIVQSCLKMFQELLSVKNMPLLELSYSLIVKDLTMNYEILAKCMEKTNQDGFEDLTDAEDLMKGSFNKTLTNDNGMVSTQNAICNVVFDLAVLTEMATLKSSVSGAWTVHPSVISLLTAKLNPLDWDLAVHFPSVHYSILTTLFCHTQRSNDFISVSHLPKQTKSNSDLESMINIVTEVLANNASSFDSRQICMLWIFEFLSSISSMPSSQTWLNSCPQQLFKTIIAASYSPEPWFAEIAAHCLSILAKIGLHDSRKLQTVLAEIYIQLQNGNPEIQQLYRDVILSLPVDTLASFPGQLFQGSRLESSGHEQERKMVCRRDIWRIKRQMMTKPVHGLINHNAFSCLISYILFGYQLENDSFSTYDIYLSSEHNRKDESQGTSDAPGIRRFAGKFGLPRNASISESVLWFWATFETAQFCILSRLKTPLGKAMETFQAIEGVIKELESSILNNSEGLNLGGTRPKQPENTTNDSGPSFTKLKQSVLLLQFLENLEKLMYNAYEGCAVSLSPVGKSVKTFFRTNRNTCQEWLSRIRKYVCQLAVNCGCEAMAVRCGYLWLYDLVSNGNTQGMEFERAVMIVLKALSNLHCWESVTGLLEWCKLKSGRNLHWLSGAVLKAKGSYEKAAELYKTAIQYYASSDRNTMDQTSEQKKPQLVMLTNEPSLSYDCTVSQFLVSEVAECYVKLGDWQEVQQWGRKLRDLQHTNPLLKGVTTDVDMNAIRAMAKFDDNDFSSLRDELDLIPGAAISNVVQEQFPVLGSSKVEEEEKAFNYANNSTSQISHYQDSWQPKQLLLQGQLQMLQAVTLYWTSGLNTLKGSRSGSLHSAAWETIDSLISDAMETANATLHSSILSENPHLTADSLLHLQTITAIKNALSFHDSAQEDTFPVSVSKHKVYLDPFKTDASSLNHALRYVSYLQYHYSLHKKGWVAPALSSNEKFSEMPRLHVIAAKLARKQQNISLAESLLGNQVILAECRGVMEGRSVGAVNAQLKLKQLTSIANIGKIGDPYAAIQILRESAKLKNDLGNTVDALDVLCSAVIIAEKHFLSIITKALPDTKLTESAGRSALLLSKWLANDSRFLGPMQQDGDTHSTVHSKINEIFKLIAKTGTLTSDLMPNSSSNSFVVPEKDLICGQLLHYSTVRCPQFGKGWYSYADWCYRWGRKAVEHASGLGKIELTDEEKQSVGKIMHLDTTDSALGSVLAVLSRAHSTRLFPGDEDLSTAELVEAPGREEEETVKRQIISAAHNIFEATPELVNEVYNFWLGIVGRVFSHYKHAVHSYFQFLKHGAIQNDKANTQHNEHANITATLRVLRLLVKYSWELQNELEAELEHTPTKPWQGIIPQLFARLNHPEPYVQSHVADLLSRIALDSPHLIIYPAVVGCSDALPAQMLNASTSGLLQNIMDVSSQIETIDDDLDISQKQQQQQHTQSQPTDQVMQSSLHGILDAIENNQPALVAEVRSVVQELRRITLLWDELWLGSLSQLHHEAQKRIYQMQEEIKRVNANQTLSSAQRISLISEKHTAMMKPLVFSLERLQCITNQIPETPHEKSFQTAFSDMIQTSIDELKSPKDPGNPTQSWSASQKLYAALQSKFQKRSVNVLTMEDISPVLANTKFVDIPMPGLNCFSTDRMVTIKSFTSEVSILPTKTKPKKLSVVGCDGEKYTYLFKGLEDLHLDERIMQFLEICNHMFTKQEKSEPRRLHARHYSVTPLGPRSGLIQWVDGATPIFALYKRWQQREISAQAQAKFLQGEKSSVVPSILRPSEVFYNKISPILKERGLSESPNSRKDWPVSMLKQIYLELTTDTPNDLLARELWCSSTSAAEWWNVTQNYTRSVAVMSMIGYAIGLGDRHLDNIMIDMTKGDVVHIDYNVCFEKGRALRVPEKVPFRMTKNLETALGLTGVEGLFRLSCENTMQCLRSGRETLLTLLEAFVYDPLVDWTVGNDSAFAEAFYAGGVAADDGNRIRKKELERGINQTLLSTRITEMQVPWMANRDALLYGFKELKSRLDSFYITFVEQISLKDNLVSHHQQVNVLKAALKQSDHPLHSLQARYDKQANLISSLKLSRQNAENSLTDCLHFISLHKNVFTKMKGNALPELYAEVCNAANPGPPCHEAAAPFLCGSGKAMLVTQCEQLETELAVLLNQRRNSLKNCLEVILSYSTIVGHFDSVYAEQTVCMPWLTVLQDLSTEYIASVCQHGEETVDAFLHARNKTNKTSHAAVNAMEAKLLQYFNEQNAKQIKLCERRSQEQFQTPALSGAVTETWNALRKFVGDVGLSGAGSLAAVTIAALATLNKRFLIMENAATVAGDRLMHLTSRDGDWFLGELCTMCGNISQLISVLKNNPYRPATKSTVVAEAQESATSWMHVLFASRKAYSGLQELIINFKSIIIPETLKGIQNNEASLFQIFDSLNDLINNSPIPLSQLTDEFLNAILFKDSKVKNESLKAVIDLRSQFEGLTSLNIDNHDAMNDDVSQSSPRMTAGQMVLAGLSGLFTRVDTDLSSLFELCRKIPHVDIAVHVDVQQDQKHSDALATQFSKQMMANQNGYYSHLLFVRQLQVIQGIFTAVQQQAGATKDLKTGVMYVFNNDKNEYLDHSLARQLFVFNEELLSLPVKQFIAECVQQCVVGIPSRSLTSLIMHYVTLLHPNLAKDLKDGRRSSMVLDDVCKRVIEHDIKSSTFSAQQLNQASSLVHAHDVAWRKQDLARRLDAAINTQKDVAQRAQLQLARFQWLHEEVLCGKSAESIPKNVVQPSRASLLADLLKSIQGIEQIEQSIPGVMDNYATTQASIEQRLRWAAGANPSFHGVLQDFDRAVSEKKQFLQAEEDISPVIKDLANGIIHLETIRNFASPEAVAFDKAMRDVVHFSSECCTSLEASTDELGDVEELIDTLKISVPPAEPITADWMASRLESVVTRLKKLKSKEVAHQTSVTSSKECLKSQIAVVKKLLTAHHNLVGDVKGLLRTLAKDEDAEECHGVRAFIALHNRYSEDAAVVLKKSIALCSLGSRSESGSASDDINQKPNEMELQEIMDTFTALVKNTHNVHDTLVLFSSDRQSSQTTETSESTDHAIEVIDASTPVDEGSKLTKPPPTSNSSISMDQQQKPTLKSPSVLSPYETSKNASSPKKNNTSVRDTKTGKVSQVRNSYAVSVWRRVKAKLEGRDFDPNVRLSVTQQVDAIIQDAISVDNLCQLYEGWTPWV